MKRKVFCVFLALAAVIPGFADTIVVEGTAPTFTTSDPTVSQFIPEFNKQLGEAFDELVDGLRDGTSSIMPDGLINTSSILEGFANAAVFASHGATLRSFAGYKTFGISVGAMTGIQLPLSLEELFNNPESILEKDDLTFGISPQFFNMSVGFHPSALIKAIPKGLYLGLRLGFFGLNLDDLDVDMGSGSITGKINTFTIGVTANYQIIPKLNLANLIIWRGLSVGSGIIVHTTTVDIGIPLGEYGVDLPGTQSELGQLAGSKLVFDPRVAMKVDITTVTIPVEAMTAITLVGLNIPLGIGFDLGMGSSELSLGLESGINVESPNNNLIQQNEAGSLSAGIRNKVAPNVYNMKLMTGFGFSIAEKVVIDIPFTYYFADNGFNIGFTLGVTF